MHMCFALEKKKKKGSGYQTVVNLIFNKNLPQKKENEGGGVPKQVEPPPSPLSSPKYRPRRGWHHPRDSVSLFLGTPGGTRPPINSVKKRSDTGKPPFCKKSRLMSCKEAIMPDQCYYRYASFV